MEDAEEGDRPTVYLTDFSIFDELGHLIDLASGLVENYELTFFSGMVKPASADSPDDPDDAQGARVVRAGRIAQWWVTGYNNEGETPTIGISTDRAGRCRSVSKEREQEIF